MKARIYKSGNQHLDSNKKHPICVLPDGPESWDTYNTGSFSRDRDPCHFLSNGEFAIENEKQRLFISRIGKISYQTKENL